jgi:hypothetical protein
MLCSFFFITPFLPSTSSFLPSTVSFLPFDALFLLFYKPFPAFYCIPAYCDFVPVLNTLFFLFYRPFPTFFCIIPVTTGSFLPLMPYSLLFSRPFPTFYTSSFLPSMISFLSFNALFLLCYCTAPATNYPSLRNSLNGCQGHLPPCLSPPDRPRVTRLDSNDVRTRSIYSTISIDDINAQSC